MVEKQPAEQFVKQAARQSTKKVFKEGLGYAAIFIVLILLTFWLVFKDQDMSEVFSVAEQSNYWFLLLGVLAMIGYFVARADNVRRVMAGIGEEVSLPKMIKFVMIEFFFCAVTPSAGGGQPVEIYYMAKEKISGTKSTLAVLVQVLDFQIAVIVLGILSQLYLAAFHPEAITGTVEWLFRLGVVTNGAALAILAICIFSKKLMKKIVDFVMRLLGKIGFKKLAAKREKINESVEKYAESAEYIKTHRKEFLYSILRTMVQVLLYFMVPMFVYMAFGLSGTPLIELIAIQAVLFVSTSALPLPGTVGVAEPVFLALFGPVFGLKLLPSALLLSRGISFYLFVIVSMLVVMGNIVWVKRHKKE